MQTHARPCRQVHKALLRGAVKLNLKAPTPLLPSIKKNHARRPQVYKAVLRESGESVAVKVQRPGVEPLIFRDIFLFRTLGTLVNGWCVRLALL